MINNRKGGPAIKMMTPNQIIEELNGIKAALNQMSIKGAENANCMLYAYQKCDVLINSINEVIKSKLENKEDQCIGDEAGE